MRVSKPECPPFDARSLRDLLPVRMDSSLDIEPAAGIEVKL